MKKHKIVKIRFEINMPYGEAGLYHAGEIYDIVDTEDRFVSRCLARKAKIIESEEKGLPDLRFIGKIEEDKDLDADKIAKEKDDSDSEEKVELEVEKKKAPKKRAKKSEKKNTNIKDK